MYIFLTIYCNKTVAVFSLVLSWCDHQPFAWQGPLLAQASPPLFAQASPTISANFISFVPIIIGRYWIDFFIGEEYMVPPEVGLKEAKRISLKI